MKSGPIVTTSYMMLVLKAERSTRGSGPRPSQQVVPFFSVKLVESYFSYVAIVPYYMLNVEPPRAHHSRPVGCPFIAVHDNIQD
jgi:hypothetical protein